MVLSVPILRGRVAPIEDLDSTGNNRVCRTRPLFQFPVSMIEDFLMFGGTLADPLRPVWADLHPWSPTPNDERELPWAAFARDEDEEEPAAEEEEDDDEEDDDDLDDEDLDDDLDDEFDDDLDDDFDDLDDEDLDDDFDDFDDDDDDDEDDEDDEVDEE